MGRLSRTPPRPVLAAALAAAAALPLPAIGLGLTFAAGGSLASPAALALAATPALGLVAGAAFSVVLRRWARTRAAWADDRAALVERRRSLAGEAAQLQSVELDLLADLETAEAELDGRDAVLGSLVDAIQHTLESVDTALQGAAPRPALTAAGQQIGELLELVDDVRRFIGTPDEDELAEPVQLEPAIATAVAHATTRVPSANDVTWSLGSDAPEWISGGVGRLDTVIEAAVREASRTAGPTPHLDIDLVVADGVRGLRIAWGATDDSGLTDGVGARIADALGQPPVLGARAKAVTWWLREPVDGALVPRPLPHARVLLAASTPGSRARLRRLLLRWGLEVSVARSGADAVARMEAGDIDLVLLDLHDESLPTLDRIRDHATLRPTPALVLSPSLDNLVWLRPQSDAGLTRPVHQAHLRSDLAEVLDLQLSAGHQLASREQPRVLVLEPNPTLAGALTRAGADVGCDMVTASTVRGLRQQAALGAWDLVLVDGDAEDLDVIAAALTDLPDDVIRLVVGASVRGKDRNDARAAGFTDAAVRPTRPAQLARLLALVTEPPAVVRGAGASTSL